MKIRVYGCTAMRYEFFARFRAAEGHEYEASAFGAFKEELAKAPY